MIQSKFYTILLLSFISTYALSQKMFLSDTKIQSDNAQCQQLPGKYTMKHYIMYPQIMSTDQCCSLCQKDNNCFYWTYWNKKKQMGFGFCYLYNEADQTKEPEAADNHFSGKITITEDIGLTVNPDVLNLTNEKVTVSWKQQYKYLKETDLILLYNNVSVLLNITIDPNSATVNDTGYYNYPINITSKNESFSQFKYKTTRGKDSTEFIVATSNKIQTIISPIPSPPSPPNPPHPHPDTVTSKSNVAMIVGIVAGVCVLITMVAIAVYYRKKKQQKEDHIHDSIEDEFIPNSHNKSNNNDIQPVINSAKEEKCQVCQTNKKNYVIVSCGHMYCKKCVEDLKFTTKKCVFCNKQFDENDIVNMYM